MRLVGQSMNHTTLTGGSQLIVLVLATLISYISQLQKFQMSDPWWKKVGNTRFMFLGSKHFF